jgi:pyruvate kinase
VFSKTGRTARLISRYRPDAPIYSFSPSKEVSDSLTLHFGVCPITQEREQTGEVNKNDVLKAVRHLKEKMNLSVGSKLIVLHGDTWAVEGGTSTIRIVEIQ